VRKISDRGKEIYIHERGPSKGKIKKREKETGREMKIPA